MCPAVTDRLVEQLDVISQRLVQPDRSAVDGLLPPADKAVGQAYGPKVLEGRSCVDVTDLDPAPTPDEVYRYFQTLPLPHLTAQIQPPGNALVGLPVIFFTTDATAQTFTVPIRGFAVVITAGATGFTWHTGDGTDVTSTGPGAPYPHATVTHQYRAGTYTASLTTTWSATFTVNGGPAQQVPGTTTTDGPASSLTVLQAHPVLVAPGS